MNKEIFDLIYFFKRKIINSWNLVKLLFIQNKLIFSKVKKNSPNHELNKSLILSITSYSARFDNLHLTLISLLLQETKPDKIILWISSDDIYKLPKKVKKLNKFGLEIKLCDDIKSFKKIIPTLRLYPDCFIVTADDDTFYQETWLKDLVASYQMKPIDIICYRAHKITFDINNGINKYALWQSEIAYECESHLLFPTGVGGVLYSPGIFYFDILNEEKFMKLCPTADDVWLYWMHRLKKSKIRTLGARNIILWYSSQKVNLWHINTGNEALNDMAINNMINEYGFPEND